MGVQRCKSAEIRECRDVRVQRCRSAEMQECRDVRVQRWQQEVYYSKAMETRKLWGILRSIYTRCQILVTTFHSSAIRKLTPLFWGCVLTPLFGAMHLPLFFGAMYGAVFLVDTYTVLWYDFSV